MQNDAALPSFVTSSLTTQLPGISIKRASECPGEHHWHIDSVRVFGVRDRSSPRIGTIKFLVLGSNGAPIENMDVLLYYDACAIEQTDSNGIASLKIFDPVDPITQVGKIIGTIGEEPADEIHGLGVREIEQNAFEITYRRN